MGATPVPSAEVGRFAAFEAYVARLQAYLRRDPVEVEGVQTSLARADDIDPSLVLPKPQVNVAATGPRTIDVAVRLADGVSFSLGADVLRLRRAIERARDACAEAGRDPRELAVGCYLQVAVADE